MISVTLSNLNWKDTEWLLSFVAKGYDVLDNRLEGLGKAEKKDQVLKDKDERESLNKMCRSLGSRRIEIVTEKNVRDWNKNCNRCTYLGTF